MKKLSLSHIERCLAAYHPQAAGLEPAPDEPLGADIQRAAVAAVLRFDRAAPEVLLMKRSARAGDHWSGQISMPGGREASIDDSLYMSAVRETYEEVGLDLESHARLIGRLDTIRAVARGRVVPLTITPYVFVQTQAAELTLSDEAVDAFWFPLGRAATGELAGEYEYRYEGMTMTLPCWTYAGHVVWGLTQRMLAQLLEIAR